MKMCVLKTWDYSNVFNIMKMWYFTLIKYFLTTILMKIPLPN